MHFNSVKLKAKDHLQLVEKNLKLRKNLSLN